MVVLVVVVQYFFAEFLSEVFLVLLLKSRSSSCVLRISLGVSFRIPLSRFLSRILHGFSPRVSTAVNPGISAGVPPRDFSEIFHFLREFLPEFFAKDFHPLLPKFLL